VVFEVVMVWTSSIWLTLETISRLLRTQHWIFEFHKIWAISRPTEQLLASEEGLCIKDLISSHLISRRWTNSLEKNQVSKVMLHYYIQNSALRLTLTRPNTSSRTRVHNKLSAPVSWNAGNKSQR